MCGLGVIVSGNSDTYALHASLRALERAQSHRGPDGRAILIEPITSRALATGDKSLNVNRISDGGLLGLAHQRLSILDRTTRGDQPMISLCERYVLCYNGEIYNYKELAQELRGAGNDSLASDAGDTAVLLACLVRWGSAALQKLNGMWAFALYDRLERTLMVARDRMGVKPLYWSLNVNGLVVASEIKGILAATGRRYAINEEVVARHLAQSLANTDTQTMFRSIEAVPAASYAMLNLDSLDIQSLVPRFERFWWHPFELNVPEQEHARPEELHDLLHDAVRIRLRSDVACGMLLSGGLDSSSILAAAHKQQPDIQVLSVVSHDPASNEEYWVKQMARHCGIKPVMLNIDEEPLSMLADLDEATWFNEAPLPGLSMIAQQRLMRAARDNGLVVLLSGQGADEQLGGYNKFLYFYLRDLLRNGQPLQTLAQAWACFARGTVFNEFQLAEAKRYLPRFGAFAKSILGPRLVHAKLCDSTSFSGYREREWRDMQALSLPLLLHSEDRMSMSCGRETRYPFIDYRIVQFLATVPTHQKFQDGWPKALLRQAMRHDLPVSVTWRRDKKGFNIPEAHWLRTAFVPYMQKFLSEPLMCVQRGLVNAQALKEQYQRFLRGAVGSSYKDVLAAITLESWLRVNEQHLTYE